MSDHSISCAIGKRKLCVTKLTPPKLTWDLSCSLQTLCISKTKKKPKKNKTNKKTNKTQQNKTSPKPFLSGKVGRALISDLKAQWKTNGAMPSQSMRNSGILMVFASDLMHSRTHLFSPPRGQGWSSLTFSSSVDFN